MKHVCNRDRGTSLWPYTVIAHGQISVQHLILMTMVCTEMRDGHDHGLDQILECGMPLRFQYIA